MRAHYPKSGSDGATESAMLGNRQRRFTRFAGTVMVVMVVMVVLMIAQAAAVLMRGELTYDNAYQLAVFAPFAILIGLLALVLLAVLAGQAIRSERRKKGR